MTKKKRRTSPKKKAPTKTAAAARLRRNGPFSYKRQRFVAEYLVDHNATGAARRARYKHPEKLGPRLLADPLIQEAIAIAIKKQEQRTGVTADRVVQELARIAFANFGDYFEWDERSSSMVPKKNLTPEQLSAVAEISSETILTRNPDGTVNAKVKLRPRLHDKVAACKLLLQNLGVLVEKHQHEVTGKDGAPLEVMELPDRELVKRARAQANRIALLDMM